MSIEQFFKAAVRELDRRNLSFAVAGGLAADLYRTDPRLTMDVDLAILTAKDIRAFDRASRHTRM